MGERLGDTKVTVFTMRSGSKECASDSFLAVLRLYYSEGLSSKSPLRVWFIRWVVAPFLWPFYWLSYKTSLDTKGEGG